MKLAVKPNVVANVEAMNGPIAPPIYLPEFKIPI